MKPLFYSHPVMMPRPLLRQEETQRQGMEQFCRRAMELTRAAALVDGSEPGLLLPTDRETARRRGLAAARRVLPDSGKGKPKIVYYRTLTGTGLHAAAETIPALAERVWVLEDRCGLADSYLRAVVDAALQQSAECVICPSPLRRDRMEAVFLPGAKAVFLSERAAEEIDAEQVRHVHLDRIPEAERRQALRQILRENQRIIEALLVRAAQNLANAEILRELGNASCAETEQRL